MKKLLTILITCSFSCINDKPVVPKEGWTKIVGVYTRADSSKILDILFRQIIKTIKYDSALKKDIIVVDTLWGYPTLIPQKDSAGKPVLDSLHKPKMVFQYVLIGKDSINWKVENIPVDSLLKKK